MNKTYIDLIERLGIEPSASNIAVIKQWHCDYLSDAANDYNAHISKLLSEGNTSALNACMIAGCSPYTIYYWRKSLPHQIVNALRLEHALIELSNEQ